jgi:hypothetical protein
MSFGSRLAAGSHDKRHNHPKAVEAKAAIRRHVLETLGAASCHVFDAFAADGEMFRRVWREAASYTACDLKWYNDARLAYVADNRRVLRSIELAPFTVFDLDAFGSPWEPAIIVADRRPLQPGERLGLILTEGSGLKLKFGSFPSALCEVAGVKPDAAGGASSHEEVVSRAISGWAARIGADAVTHRWEAVRSGGSAMRYIGLVLEKKKRPGAVKPPAVAGPALLHPR